MEEDKTVSFSSVTYCEDMQKLKRVTDAKNRTHIGKEASEALRNGKSVYIIIGEIVE